jgi:flavodoxin I
LKEVGVFYGSSSGKTESVALKIHELLGEGRAGIYDIVECSPHDLLSFKMLILGIPTWGIGELQEDWAGFLPGLEKLELSGRKVALFGLGDQESYPDTFADALGALYDSLCDTGCEIIGSWPAEGYHFMGSAALRNESFVGLILDEDNQKDLTKQRIKEWLGRIIPDFN